MNDVCATSRAIAGSLLVFTVACASTPSGHLESVPLGIPLRGQVLYPDGRPAPGATVRAETVCVDSTAHFVDEAITGTDGTFEIRSFDAYCGQVRFSAEYRGAFWLKTGKEVFYPGPNGTTPEVDIRNASPPQPVNIVLGSRG